MKLNRLVLLVSLVYGVAGIVLTFAPDELLARAGATPAPVVVWLGQLLGAALLGLAFLNWLQRHAVVGGILGRPLLLTNLTFLMVSFFASVHQWRAAGTSPLFAATSVVLGLLAAAFGLRLFRAPPDTRPR